MNGNRCPIQGRLHSLKLLDQRSVGLQPVPEAQVCSNSMTGMGQEESKGEEAGCMHTPPRNGPYNTLGLELRELIMDVHNRKSRNVLDHTRLCCFQCRF